MEDLRHALLYFIRKPVEPQLAILTDAVVANHKLILLMERVNRSQETKLDIRQHLELYGMKSLFYLFLTKKALCSSKFQRFLRH